MWFEVIQRFTGAGVILQQFSVATATAVDPALRGQQTQVLAPSVVHTTQGELTLGRDGEVRRGHPHKASTRLTTHLQSACMNAAASLPARDA